jgi:hypothetical protein
MKSLKDLILSRTPIISIPSKMAFYSPNGKLKEVSTLTKGGAISTRNKEKVIQFIGNADDVFKISNQGYSENNNPQKQRKKGVEDKYVKFTNLYKLSPFPPSGTLGLKAMYNYYKKFINALKLTEDEAITDDRVKMRQFMVKIIKSS